MLESERQQHDAEDTTSRAFTPSVPADEPAPTAPDVGQCVRDAVLSLTGRPALNAVKDGRRSEVLLSALEPARLAIESQVKADLGADADGLPATLGRLVGAFAETSLLRESVFLRMSGQPTTAKGAARRLLSAYVSLVDRELRLAQAIGLHRRPKDINDLARAFSEPDAR